MSRCSCRCHTSHDYSGAYDYFYSGADDNLYSRSHDYSGPYNNQHHHANNLNNHPNNHNDCDGNTSGAHMAARKNRLPRG